MINAIRAFGTNVARETKDKFPLLVLSFALALAVFAISYYGLTSFQVQEVFMDNLTYSLSIVDHGQDREISKMIRDELARIPLVAEVYQDSPDQAQARLDQGQVLFVFEIPDGFIEEFQRGRFTGKIKLAFNPDLPVEAQEIAGPLPAIFRSISLMEHSALVYQEMYTELGGREELSWLSLTGLTLELISKYGQRHLQISGENLSPQQILAKPLAGLLVLLAVLPGIFIGQDQVKLLNEGLRAKLVQQGRYGSRVLAKILVFLLQAFTLLAPFIFGLYYLDFINLDQSLASLGLLGLIALSSLLIALSLANFSGQAKGLLLLSWPTVIILLFLAGVISPWDLFPLGLKKVAELSPWLGPHQALVMVLSQSPVKSDLISLRPSYASLLALLSVVPIYLISEKWRQAR